MRKKEISVNIISDSEREKYLSEEEIQNMKKRRAEMQKEFDRVKDIKIDKVVGDWRFKDDERIRGGFMDKYNLSDTVSQCFNSIQEQSVLATERMMLSDIIDIYKGVYKDYDEYYKAVVEYNQVCREHNTPKFENGKFNYTMTFMIEKNLFLKRQFDFIRALALKEVQDA